MRRKAFLLILVLGLVSCKCENSDKNRIDRLDILKNGIEIDYSYAESASAEDLYEFSSDVFSIIIDPRTSNDSLSINTALYYAIESYNRERNESTAYLIAHLYASIGNWENAMYYLDLEQINSDNYLLQFYKAAVLFKMGNIEQFKSVLRQSYEQLLSHKSLSVEETIHILVMETLLYNEEKVIIKMDSILANESNIYLSDFRNTYFPGFDFNQFIDHSIFIKSIELKAEDFYVD